jgi:hypothetical protein
VQDGWQPFIPKDAWHEIWSRRLFSSREFKGWRFYVDNHLETPNPEVPMAPKVEPAVSRGSLSRPSKADTWHAMRLSAFSPIAVSKRKEQLPHTPDAQSDESVQDLGPTVASGQFMTIRFEGRVARDLVTSAFQQSQVQRVEVLCR